MLLYANGATLEQVRGLIFASTKCTYLLHMRCKYIHGHSIFWPSYYGRVAELETYIHAYIFVDFNFDALAQASDIQIERREVVFLSTYLPTYIPTYLHTYLPTYIHTYIHTYMHACMHACMHARMHAPITDIPITLIDHFTVNDNPHWIVNNTVWWWAG